MAYFKKSASLVLLTVAAACAVQEPVPDNPPNPYPSLPESVVALAAPHQNLADAQLNPADNCYWYRHVGVVETTWLPLKTTTGAQICQAVPDTV